MLDVLDTIHIIQRCVGSVVDHATDVQLYVAKSEGLRARVIAAVGFVQVLSRAQEPEERDDDEVNDVLVHPSVDRVLSVEGVD